MLQKLLEKFLILCLLLLSKEKGPEIGSSPPSKVSWKTLMKRMKETAIKNQDLEYYGTRKKGLSRPNTMHKFNPNYQTD